MSTAVECDVCAAFADASLVMCDACGDKAREEAVVVGRQQATADMVAELRLEARLIAVTRSMEATATARALRELADRFEKREAKS